MYSFTHRHRVRYRECDPMGFLYPSHYVDLFEIARTEAYRALGVSYRAIEESGVIMPVIDLSIRYKKPSRYDDLLEITCTVHELPHTRLTIEYEVRRIGDEALRVTGSVTLCFVDVKRNRPIAIPEKLRIALDEAISAGLKTENTTLPTAA